MRRLVADFAASPANRGQFLDGRRGRRVRTVFHQVTDLAAERADEVRWTRDRSEELQSTAIVGGAVPFWYWYDAYLSGTGMMRKASPEWTTDPWYLRNLGGL